MPTTANPDDGGPQAPPPQWGEDGLTAFIQTAQQGAWASFVQPKTRPWFERLEGIDRAFLQAINALNGHNPNYFEGLMLLCGHAAFRSAAEFALQGRVCETMVMARSCLEYAMYGVHFRRHPELIEVWSHRGDGEKERKAVRKSFKTVEMLDGITALNNAVGPRARTLYERSIDMGAHPNETGFFGRLTIDDVPGTDSKKMNIKYLQGGELGQDVALKLIAQVGVCTLECFWLLYRERFEILGVKATIDTLKHGL